MEWVGWAFIHIYYWVIVDGMLGFVFLLTYCCIDLYGYIFDLYIRQVSDVRCVQCCSKIYRRGKYGISICMPSVDLHKIISNTS